MARKFYTQEDISSALQVVKWMNEYEIAQKELGHTPSLDWYRYRSKAAEIAGVVL